MNFKCSYCGKEHNTAIERAGCEILCDRTKKDRDEKVKKEKLNKEKEVRLKEIQNTYDLFVKQACKYEEDYNMPIRLKSSSYSELYPPFLTVYDLLF